MKKIMVRIVALAVLAVMLLSCLPAFAAIVGTIESSTTMRKKPDNSSSIVANVKGGVTINYQSYDGQYYQVTLTSDGKSYTGWVPKSAVTGIGRQTTTGGSTGSTSTGSTSTGSTSTGSTGTSSGGSSYSSAQYTGTLANLTSVYDSSNKLVANVRGSVQVNGRDSAGSRINITAAGGGNTASGWVPATAVSNLNSTSTGPVSVNSLPVTGGVSGSASAASYTPYTPARVGVSKDSVIYMRKTANKSTSSSNVNLKVTSARDKTFNILGIDSTGNWYYAEYNGTQGFVREQDFAVTAAGASTGTGTTATPTPTATPVPSTSTGTGSTGGMVSSSSGSSGATSVGKNSSSEKWGTFTVPGASTYPIYGNYTNAKGNLYYYDHSNIGSYKYLHTTTALGSQVHVVMGHNMRDSRTYFHNLHHIQNALGGYGKCESCGNSCSTSTYGTTISAQLDGASRWEVMCFYEVPKKSQTSILEFAARPWKTTTSSYVSTQLQYANQSGLKGWVNPSVTYSDSGKYMMLITCGDKYDSSSNSTAKLYMLLKAVG